MQKKWCHFKILSFLLAVSMMVLTGYGCDFNGEGCGDSGTGTDTPTDTDGSADNGTSGGTDTSSGMFRVNADGKITVKGNELPIQCGAWFGLEGQYEPNVWVNGELKADEANGNAGGAPMELYVGNMFWRPSGRDIPQTMRELKEHGFNVIRLPIVPQTLDPNDPQGQGDKDHGGALKNHPDVRQDNARQALEKFIKDADDNGLYVIVDIHSCSNYVGWRAGRLDAEPPYADNERDNYEYKREDCTCGPYDPTMRKNQAYNESKWLEDLKEIAELPKQLGVDNLLAIDIFNEPWDYTWAEWKRLAENAYKAIDSVNKDVLIMVEGIGSETHDKVKIPHGDASTNPNWGENFFPAKSAPLNIPKNRLILSPHTYGPSVFVQRQFLDPSQGECKDLEGEAAGDKQCRIVIDPVRLEAGWEEHFGFLKDQGYAVVIGEFGGLLDWPQGAEERVKSHFRYVTDDVDRQWQHALVDYMNKKGIEGCYWSINPESTDTGGLYNHAYSEADRGGWGTWLEINQERVDILEELWNN